MLVCKISFIHYLNFSLSHIFLFSLYYVQVLLPCSSDQTNVSTDGPDYLDDVESPLADDKAVCRTESSNNRFYSGSWLRTAANYFSNSFW